MWQIDRETTVNKLLPSDSERHLNHVALCSTLAPEHTVQLLFAIFSQTQWIWETLILFSFKDILRKQGAKTQPG